MTTHAHIGTMTLWNTQVHPKNVLKDLNKTLDEVFRFSEQPDFTDTTERLECTMFYDFQPMAPDCPLLLSSPRITAPPVAEDQAPAKKGAARARGATVKGKEAAGRASVGSTTTSQAQASSSADTPAPPDGPTGSTNTPASSGAAANGGEE